MDKKKKLNAALITYIVMIIMLALDQISKQLVINHMPIQVFVDTQKYTASETHEIFWWLWLNHVVNFGAAWSIFFGKTYLLLLFALVIFSAIVYYEVISRNVRTKTLSAGLGFIMGGAGNFIDRARMGYVTDFFEFRNRAGHNAFPIFNVADMSIDAGIVLLIIYFFFQEDKIKKAKTSTNEEDEPIPTEN